MPNCWNSYLRWSISGCRKSGEHTLAKNLPLSSSHYPAASSSFRSSDPYYWDCWAGITTHWLIAYLWLVDGYLCEFKHHCYSMQNLLVLHLFCLGIQVLAFQCRSTLSFLSSFYWHHKARCQTHLWYFRYLIHLHLLLSKKAEVIFTLRLSSDRVLESGLVFNLVPSLDQLILQLFSPSIWYHVCLFW